MAYIKEIDKWHKNLQNTNVFRIKTNKLTSKIVYSDASGFVYVGFILQRICNIISHGYFTEHEMLTSSTNRELLTVKNVMERNAQSSILTPARICFMILR